MATDTTEIKPEPKKIIECLPPGIYTDVKEEDYHRMPAVNASRLKTMAKKSPMHVDYEMRNPSEPTAAMLFGSALHRAILEPQRFSEEYFVSSGCAKCKNNGKFLGMDGKWYCGVHAKSIELADIDSSRMLTEENMNKIKAMRSQVLSHVKARKLLSSPGNTELTAIADDPITGERCKIRMDYYSAECEGEPAIMDIKTCEDASPDGFQRQIVDYGYDIQAAFYIDTMQIATLGQLHQRFFFIAIEKEAPFAVAVYKMHTGALDFGRERYRKAIAAFHLCKEKNVWPGYNPLGDTIIIPNWFMNKKPAVEVV